MNLKNITIDREYLKRCRESTPEQRLEWLASALEFGKVKKRIVVQKKRS